MRKLFLLTSCILICNIIFSQPKTKEYFLEKSKNQKKIAWILLATGTAAIVTGVLIEAPQRGTGNSQSFTGGLIEVGGIISVLTSIPFFISSSKNKKRGATLTINNQRILSPLNNSFVVNRQTSVSLNILL